MDVRDPAEPAHPRRGRAGRLFADTFQNNARAPGVDTQQHWRRPYHHICALQALCSGSSRFWRLDAPRPHSGRRTGPTLAVHTVDLVPLPLPTWASEATAARRKSATPPARTTSPPGRALARPSTRRHPECPAAGSGALLPFLASDDHGHAVATASASELTHQHPVDVPADGHPEHGHSSECVSPGLAPQPQGGSQSTAGAATVLSLAIASAPAMAEPPAAPPGADRTPIAQSGRSTLTSICRWRI